MTGGVRVLHVDDEPDFVETTARHLELEDDRFEVETATSAEEALTALADDSEGYDCVVSDHEMPGTSGIELLEEVREEYPDLPFILFTGKGSEEVASEAISKGVTDYLQKRGGAGQYAVLANRVLNAVETARAKATARRSQKRFESLSEAFPDVAFYIDEDGRYVEFIAGRESPLLYDEAEELVGQRIHDVFPSETADRFYGVIQDALETGDLQKIEYELDVQAGERFFEARVAALDAEVMDSEAVIWVARDITERKERERELERQNDRLEDFASVVSHDLRNPLTVAEGHLELARENCDSEHLDAVARAHDRMGAIVDNLLTLSRSGDRVEDVEPVPLAETVEECWRNVETESATLVIDIGDDGDDEDGVIEADGGRLRRMLENLVRNSVEHGGDDVTVEVGDMGEEVFYVADDGVSVPEEERDEVFESGYTTSDDGTGFGLSIVEEIAEAHGWEVNLKESAEGGARFEVSGVDLMR